jgi:K+-sensing histidine kinase KdpD
VDPLRPPREDFESSAGGYLIGGFVPIVIGAALVPVRDDIEHTTSVLIMVLVVVLAAIAGGRWAGVLAAFVAAASFDFFLTQPYQSLRIDSESDIETTVMLLVIGILVGQIVVFARRNRRAADRAADEIGRLRRVAESAASGLGTDELADVVEEELSGLLGLRECTFHREKLERELPTLERSGTISVTEHRFDPRGGFTLPAQGVELPVLGGGETVGRLVLVPEPGVGVSLDARIVAIALADQLGARLASSTSA